MVVSGWPHLGSPSSNGASAIHSSQTENGRNLYEPVQWGRLAKQLDKSGLSPTKVIEAILDTFGLSKVVELIGELAHPGAYCLALAEAVVAGKAPDSDGDALYWASRAADCGVPPGSTSRLIAIGLDISKVDTRPIEKAREHLLDLARKVQDRFVYSETERLGEWMDACAIAARRDRLGLNTAEALLSGPGWYTCWLRFTISLVVAEAAPSDQKSQSGLEALRILTEVQNPFLGDPRACDLYPINGLIDETIRRAISLLDDQAWEEAINLLDRVSAAISTTLFGAMGGPIARDRLLHLAVETATSERRIAAQILVNDEIENRGGGRHYSDLAEYRLLAARLALNGDDPIESRQHWMDACRLLTAYGGHKDITIYELLDPLPSLIAIDPARGRTAVAKLQPLCERVPQHTDGRGTNHTWGIWWELLAAADPCALSRMIQPRLLSSCNDPNGLLHGARSDLWGAWYHRADPMVAGALRLTLEGPLDQNDPSALSLLADVSDGTGQNGPSRLLTALMARFDERPIKYGYTNDNELLDRDCKRIDELNAIAEHMGGPRITPLPSHSVQSQEPATSGNPRSKTQPRAHLPDQAAMMFQPGTVGIAQAIRAWRVRRYDETQPGWSVERFANVLEYQIIELIKDGREADAESALRLIAEAGRIDDSPRLLKALAEGFERHDQFSLAAMAYTLTWTRTRGQGGWLMFGGETEIESLQRATQIDRTLALRIIAEEVERVVTWRPGMCGVGQALMYGFAKGGLGTSNSVAFDIWDEAFAVIADRAPRVASVDDPEDVYMPPDSDFGTDLPGDIDTAFAAAAVAGLSHGGREQKRRSLIATRILIDQRTSSVIAALRSALSSLSDPATLTWLLRVIELAGDKAASIVSESRSVLIELAGCPHLTVRTLARRLLSSDEAPLVPPAEPDSELLEWDSSSLVLPADITVDEKDTKMINGMIDDLAGARLMHAERILPGLREAVHNRVDAVMKSEEHKHRMKVQWDAYTNSLSKRWPDAYLALDETVENAIQQAAAGARAARLMNGESVENPAELEELLAKALLDDPELPLAVESTRQPRPEIPPPPLRNDPLWCALHAYVEGGSVDEIGIEAATQNKDILLGTVAIGDTKAVPALVGGPYDGWRLVATLEQRVISRPDRENKDDIAERYRIVELRFNGDRQALTLPPVTEGDIRLWSSLPVPNLSANGRIRTQPIIGSDSAVKVAGDGHHGLGIQTNLLTPTAWLFEALGLKPSTHFVLDDEAGRALALITWRTEYETSNYHLAWPRLYGAGLVVRRDAFETLVRAAQGKLIFRDFLVGPLSLGG